MSFSRGLLCLAVVVVLGCGGGGGKSASQTKGPSTDNIKSTLQEIAKGGQAEGSLMAGLEMGIQGMKQSDPAKADALAKDLQELKKMRPPETAAKAKAMLDKLEAAK